MMFDRLRHGRMLPIGDAVFFGGLLDDPGKRSIVGVAYKRAQMMHDMVVEPAHQPADERGLGRVVGRGREDMVDPVVKLTAARGKVSAVHRVRGLENES